MWWRLTVASVLFAIQLTYANHIVQNQGPCNFLDTINITSGHPDQNGNFHHKGIVYKKGTFQEYDHIVENYTQMIRVEPHIRGCVCGYKPCIRLCCTGKDSSSSPCVTTDTMRVPTQDEDEEEIDLKGKSYGVLVGKPCGRMYKLEPTEYDYDRWFFSVSKSHSPKNVSIEAST